MSDDLRHDSPGSLLTMRYSNEAITDPVAIQGHRTRQTSVPCHRRTYIEAKSAATWGCTQLHHLNEAMPFRTAGRSSSSWSHRRAPIYLRRSHMPLYAAHKRLPLRWRHSVASCCPPEQNQCLTLSRFRNRGHRCKWVGEHLCCYSLLRRTVQTTCGLA